MKKIAIIIVTWNGMKWIEKCLNSIRESNYPSTVFLIDNNSPDETPDFVEKKFPEVRITRSNINLGFGKANNIGISQAINEEFDYIFLLNQDAYIEPNTIEELLKVAINNDFGIISPVHMNGDGKKVDPYFQIVLSKSNTFLDNSILHGTETLFESKFIPAAAWFIPIKTIEEIGGFDSLFFHYGEDDNYCQRCIYHNKKIVFTTNARIRHDRENTVGNIKMYNNKLAFRLLMIESANILNSKGYIIQKLGRQFYDEVGLFLMYFLTGEWNKIHNFIGNYVKLLYMLPSINRSRKYNKTIHGLEI